jgi:ABC-type polysaccharide/polyol phosphate transport system ATPase subunit
VNAVRCEGVSKSYRSGPVLGLKERLVGKHRRQGRFVRPYALSDISFTVPTSSSFGIVGPNGSGKSTLLGLLLGVLRPDRGAIEVQGRLASLLALGAGFHPELTGRQNIFLHAAILGMTLAETRRAFQDIVDFSELGEAVDNPLRTYSSGMMARLGFSVIVHAGANVLLIDEVLAVGDLQFQDKCRTFLRDFRRRGGTLLIATHDMTTLRDLCDDAVCLNEGRIAGRGSLEAAVRAYEATVRG